MMMKLHNKPNRDKLLMKKVVERNWIKKDVSLWKNSWDYLEFSTILKVYINDQYIWLIFDDESVVKIKTIFLQKIQLYL
jgi:hypothetical protein